METRRYYHTALYIGMTMMALTTLLFSACSKSDEPQPEPPQQIEVKVLHVAGQSDNYGTLTGGGVYPQGAKVTITAEPQGNYAFYRWTKNDDDEGGTLFSMAQSYTFVANEPVTLYAVFQGDGVNFPRFVGSVDELKAINDDLTKKYKLVAGLDLAGQEVMIGKDGSDFFSGEFDGNNERIQGLTINSQTGESSIGLFRTVDKTGVVKNVWLWHPNVFGANNVGAVVGNNKGRIEACQVSGGSIKGNNNVGGVAGYCGDDQNNYPPITGGEIINSRSSATVDGMNHVGGIAGYFRSGLISGCQNSGAVSASQGDSKASQVNAGGIAGMLWNMYSTIKASYNKGEVTADNYVGGIVGDMRGDVSGCYNIGKVTATEGTYVGAIAGQMYLDRHLYDSYYTYVEGLKGIGYKYGNGQHLDESRPFGDGTGGTGWPVWNERWTNTDWKDLGGWSPTNPRYPTLLWQGTASAGDENEE